VLLVECGGPFLKDRMRGRNALQFLARANGFIGPRRLANSYAAQIDNGESVGAQRSHPKKGLEIRNVANDRIAFARLGVLGALPPVATHESTKSTPFTFKGPDTFSASLSLLSPPLGGKYRHPERAREYSYVLGEASAGLQRHSRRWFA
jgi:hypothetical protein